MGESAALGVAKTPGFYHHPGPVTSRSFPKVFVGKLCRDRFQSAKQGQGLEQLVPEARIKSIMKRCSEIGFSFG